MEIKHTPAPWQYCASGTNDHITLWSYDLTKCIALISTPRSPNKVGAQESFANARLIAEAPRMLEALLIAKKCIEGNQADDERIKALIIINNAILTATGEA